MNKNLDRSLELRGSSGAIGGLFKPNGAATRGPPSENPPAVPIFVLPAVGDLSYI